MAQSPIAQPLLQWYEQNKRILPFRTLSTPYRVWVSEIMLQQTRVSAALPYFERFMQQLPTVADLAACDEEKLHKLWEGLGYYSRVRNLQKAARMVMEQYGGELPADYQKLLSLPGIGAYTAGAIASISFGLPVPAVDGNVLRVFSRLFCDRRDITQTPVKNDLTALVMKHQPPERPGDYNQALMELGALVCVPNGPPQCSICPLKEVCKAFQTGVQEQLPFKAPPPEKRREEKTIGLVLAEGRVLLQKRPAKGLLAGLWQPVVWDGRQSAEHCAEQLALMGILAEPCAPLPAARHVFSHIIWQMEGFWFDAKPCPAPEGFVWASRAELETLYTLPGAFKVYRAALEKRKEFL